MHKLVLHHALDWFEVDGYEHKGLCGCWLEWQKLLVLEMDGAYT